jgi:hypothetical protein
MKRTWVVMRKEWREAFPRGKDDLDRHDRYPIDITGGFTLPALLCERSARCES